MAEVFGRTVRLVRDVEISLHHPTARGRAFDDIERCREKRSLKRGDRRPCVDLEGGHSTKKNWSYTR